MRPDVPSGAETTNLYIFISDPKCENDDKAEGDDNDAEGDKNDYEDEHNDGIKIQDKNEERGTEEEEQGSDAIIAHKNVQTEEKTQRLRLKSLKQISR